MSRYYAYISRSIPQKLGVECSGEGGVFGAFDVGAAISEDGEFAVVAGGFEAE